MPDATRLRVRQPETGEPLAPKEQPGYYPGFSTLRQKAYWDATTRALIEKRVAGNKPADAQPLRFFTDPGDAAAIRAVVDRVLPQEDRTEDRRIDIVAGIDARLSTGRIEGYRYEDMPSDEQAYRIALRAFAAMAQALHGQPFAALGTREQEEILRSVHHAEPSAAGEIWAEMNIERFWEMLVADCVSVYYAHPWAWDEIGFGGPAYPRGYMRLEEGEAEPWEVEERRYGWLAPADTVSDAEEAHGSGAAHQSHQGQGGTH